MEYFDSWGFKNREAKEIVFQSLPWSCSREATNPLCEASVLTLVLRFTSKWVFSARLMVSCLIFSNAFVWSEFYWNIDFLFNRALSGLPKEAKFGTNLMYWFIDPKNDLKLFRFFGIGRSFIAFVLSNKGEILVFEILNPNHSTSFWKKIDFDHLTAKLYSSNVDKSFITTFLWSKKVSLDAI